MYSFSRRAPRLYELTVVLVAEEPPPAGRGEQLPDRVRELRVDDGRPHLTRCLARKRNVIRLPRTLTCPLRSVVIP